jgi:hypothetical protein
MDRQRQSKAIFMSLLLIFPNNGKLDNKEYGIENYDMECDSFDLKWFWPPLLWAEQVSSQ